MAVGGEPEAGHGCAIEEAMSHDQMVRVDDEDAGRARGVDRPAIGGDDDATTDRTAPAVEVFGKDD